MLPSGTSSPWLPLPDNNVGPSVEMSIANGNLRTEKEVDDSKVELFKPSTEGLREYDASSKTSNSRDNTVTKARSMFLKKKANWERYSGVRTHWKTQRVHPFSEGCLFPKSARRQRRHELGAQQNLVKGVDGIALSTNFDDVITADQTNSERGKRDEMWRQNSHDRAR